MLNVKEHELVMLRREMAHQLIRLAAHLVDEGASLAETITAAEDLLALAHSEESAQADRSEGGAARLLADRAVHLNNALVAVFMAEFAIAREQRAFMPDPV